MKLAINVEPSQWAEPFLDVVFNCGLNIVEKEKAEVLVMPASEITAEDLESGLKIIALEKTDGGNIVFKNVLKHKSVTRYITPYNYNSFELHNIPCVDGRFFSTLLSHNLEPQDPDYLIDEKDYNKIKEGWNFLHYFRLREILSLETDELFQKNDQRPIDVFFAGRVDYDDKEGTRKSAGIISEHRKKCAEVLESMTDCETLIVKGKHLGLKAYNQIICHSKVVVSPWGWGEPCYRDYEAILAGCILIKPLTNFIKSSCGMFENTYCIWTNPDFSNLENDVRLALRNFGNTRYKRKANRENLVKRVEALPLIVRDCLTV